MKVVVTGFGIVSAAGWGANETEQSLIECRGGLGPLQLFESVRCAGLPVAEVQGAKAVPGQPRTVTLGTIALTEALAMSGLIASDVRLERIGLSLGTCVGGMPESEQAAVAVVEGGAPEDPSVWERHESGYTTSALARGADLRGPTLTVSTACASGAQAIANGAELLRAGMADAVVAGGVDALCKLTLNGFASLLLVDAQGCRPFDIQRAGMNLGEGAAFLVLEPEAAARARGARVLAVLAGYANTCDAYHVTAPEPQGQGAERAMRGALEQAGVEPSRVGYVNAHGTGTKDNDKAEGQAIARVLGVEQDTPISSTKRMFGHTLGAAGAIEAVVSVMAIERAFVPGTRSVSTRDPECVIEPLTRSHPSKPKVVLSNSFGFGGNNTVLCFTDPDQEVVTPDLTRAMPSLTVTGYAVAGFPGEEQLPESRRCGLPPAGHHKRRARLPRLAVDLAKAACGGQVPEATGVLFGTALGSLTETEAFVENMIRERESAPMPRAFSASVHNAAASRIAIALAARGENQTFVGGALSFAQALFAATRRRLREGAQPTLVGACDELTDYVRRGHKACSSSGGEPGEGGALLYCDGPEAPALATVRLVALGRVEGALAPWLAEHGVEAALTVSETGPVAIDAAGRHPSRLASAVALAVALVSEELPPSALGLDATGAPSSVAVVERSRFGEAAVVLVEAPK